MSVSTISCGQPLFDFENLFGVAGTVTGRSGNPLIALPRTEYGMRQNASAKMRRFFQELNCA